MGPLKFEPIFKSMLWGGHRLPEWLGQPAPHTDPIGEAWVLSDVEGHSSRVAIGPEQGRTLRELIQSDPEAIFGQDIPVDGRFPLLLKFIDARQELSVQVHPNDAQAVAQKGTGHRGKTEAWVILESDPVRSRIYAGVAPGIGELEFQEARQAGRLAACLHQFIPKPGDCVFLPAGTVHAIGAGILLFEVQQTSDITYRIHDWDRVDPKSGQPRELHWESGLACTNWAAGPRQPQAQRQGELVCCEFFKLNRETLSPGATLGRPGGWEALVILDGTGYLGDTPTRRGDVWLLPAAMPQRTWSGQAEVLRCGPGEL